MGEYREGWCCLSVKEGDFTPYVSTNTDLRSKDIRLYQI